MLTILSCIAFEHDRVFLLMAVSILVVGSVVTMRLFARVRRTHGQLKILWLMLAGIIAGGTIWSTHFVSMLAYKSDLILGYHLDLTALSLVIAVVGTTLGLFIAAATKKSLLIEAGGLVFGFSIVAMHFTGVEAMAVSGLVGLSQGYVVASVICAGLFGMLATSRIARPATRFCKYGASVSFIAAVASMHFIAMSGLDITPLRLSAVDAALISDRVVGLSVVATMIVLIFVAMASYTIDAENSKASETKIKHLAQHDPLTGLSNRSGLELHLEGALEKTARDNSHIAVISCSLLHQRDFSEVFGRTKTRRLLQSVAGVLADCLHPCEFVAHLGEGHFVVVGKAAYYTGYVQDLCRRVHEAVNGSAALEVTAMSTVGSVLGYAIYPDHADTPADLVTAAEKAMRLAKQKGVETSLCYNPSEDEQARDRSALSIDLRNALSNNEFVLFYQPQNETKTGALVGAEVLLRWNHPGRGLVPPFAFIPIAEETGLIAQIGRWIIFEACREAASWDQPVKIAVNVAPIQLSDSELPMIVAQALSDSGLPPHRLDLEITETGIVEDTSQALKVINELKHLGVGIAMDDFGTGYSSLSMLQTFPFDKIKIDREFIKDLGDNPQSEAIVKATCILAGSLDIPVLAEGVESETQIEALRDLGVKELQGFYFGKPVDAQTFKSQHISGLIDEPGKVSESQVGGVASVVLHAA